MKEIYVVRLLHVDSGKIIVHIVKATSEAEALEMMPGGHEVLDIQSKGAV